MRRWPLGQTLLALVLGLTLLQAIYLITLEVVRLDHFRQEAARLERENRELARRVHLLEADLAAVREDEEAVLEAEARRAGLVRKDELLFPRATH